MHDVPGGTGAGSAVLGQLTFEALLSVTEMPVRFSSPVLHTVIVSLIVELVQVPLAHDLAMVT